VSDEPGVAGEQQGDLVRRLRAVVEAKDAEIGVLRGELAAERELRRRLELRADVERRQPEGWRRVPGRSSPWRPGVPACPGPVAECAWPVRSSGARVTLRVCLSGRARAFTCRRAREAWDETNRETITHRGGSSVVTAR
jgi:hypothetical protein